MSYVADAGQYIGTHCTQVDIDVQEEMFAFFTQENEATMLMMRPENVRRVFLAKKFSVDIKLIATTDVKPQQSWRNSPGPECSTVSVTPVTPVTPVASPVVKNDGLLRRDPPRKRIKVEVIDVLSSDDEMVDLPAIKTEREEDNIRNDYISGSPVQLLEPAESPEKTFPDRPLSDASPMPTDHVPHDVDNLIHLQCSSSTNCELENTQTSFTHEPHEQTPTSENNPSFVQEACTYLPRASHERESFAPLSTGNQKLEENLYGTSRAQCASPLSVDRGEPGLDRESLSEGALSSAPCQHPDRQIEIDNVDSCDQLPTEDVTLGEFDTGVSDSHIAADADERAFRETSTSGDRRYACLVENRQGAVVPFIKPELSEQERLEASFALDRAVEARKDHTVLEVFAAKTLQNNLLHIDWSHQHVQDLYGPEVNVSEEFTREGFSRYLLSQLLGGTPQGMWIEKMDLKKVLEEPATLFNANPNSRGYQTVCKKMNPEPPEGPGKHGTFYGSPPRFSDSEFQFPLFVNYREKDAPECVWHYLGEYCCPAMGWLDPKTWKDPSMLGIRRLWKRWFLRSAKYVSQEDAAWVRTTHPEHKDYQLRESEDVEKYKNDASWRIMEKKGENKSKNNKNKQDKWCRHRGDEKQLINFVAEGYLSGEYSVSFVVTVCKGFDKELYQKLCQAKSMGIGQDTAVVLNKKNEKLGRILLRNLIMERARMMLKPDGSHDRDLSEVEADCDSQVKVVKLKMAISHQKKGSVTSQNAIEDGDNLSRSKQAKPADVRRKAEENKAELARLEQLRRTSGFEVSSGNANSDDGSDSSNDNDSDLESGDEDAQTVPIADTQPASEHDATRVPNADESESGSGSDGAPDTGAHERNESLDPEIGVISRPSPSRRQPTGVIRRIRARRSGLYKDFVPSTQSPAAKRQTPRRSKYTVPPPEPIITRSSTRSLPRRRRTSLAYEAEVDISPVSRSEVIPIDSDSDSGTAHNADLGDDAFGGSTQIQGWRKDTPDQNFEEEEEGNRTPFRFTQVSDDTSD